MTEKPSTPTKLCPTCGTRVSEDATRCLVCGSDLTASSDSSSKPARSVVEGSRMPAITLSLPAALGLLTLFLAIGAVLVFFALQDNLPSAAALEPSATPTITETPAPTESPTPENPTPTDTPLPTATPSTYTVQSGDTCSGIAFAFGVSIQSIVLQNNLPADCGALREGQQLLIPQPTPTPTAMPTATLSAGEATAQACGKFEYTVQESDTLSSISLNFNVPVASIRDYNGLVNDTVRFGQVLDIPLCERIEPAGPTATPTPPPPYPAPNLLLPADGASFSVADEGVTLQWASVGTLRENEAYAVTIEDVTGGEARKMVDYVIDTKFIVPNSFRPNESVPHALRWWIVPVRQTGTDDDGNAIWEPAGSASEPRVFIWTGAGAPSSSPTPEG